MASSKSSGTSGAVDFNAKSGNMNTSKKTLKRMEFVFNKTSYKFTLNPESYVQNENGRVTVTQTKGGAFVELFGKAVGEISIVGTTGFKNGTKDAENGYKKFKKLRDLIKKFYDNITDGKAIKDSDLLWFYNYTDNEYYKCVADKFELSRNKSQPHLYKYDIHLYIIRRIGENAPSTTVETIGNPAKVESTKTKTETKSTPTVIKNNTSK